MSRTTVLAVAPERRPRELLELHNAFGWAASIWPRLLGANGLSEDWILDNAGLHQLWRSIEELPEWQQVPLVLTFDTGVIPFQEFDRRLPAPEGHVNHVPAVATLLRSGPETPLIGVYGTSVSDNPFDPFNYEDDEPGSGIPLTAMYVLPQHRRHLPGGA